MAYEGLSNPATFYFLQCRTWGAKLTPLVSIYPLHNTPVAQPRPCGGSNYELPILTQIYPSVDAGVPPVSPQSFSNGRYKKQALVAPWPRTGRTRRLAAMGRNVRQVCANGGPPRRIPNGLDPDSRLKASLVRIPCR